MKPTDTSQQGLTYEYPEGVSIGAYLLRRLQELGLRDVFGIPGDYILSFYGLMEKSPLRVIGCTREDCAGFAADAYARIHGLGAICVTYCVGGLSVCNSIAGAFAEKSPVVMITGSPGLSERVNNPLLHHKVRDFRTQLEVFEKLCIAGTELHDPNTAFREIDRVLDAVLRYKRPGYIEIPRDMVHVVPENPYPYRRERPTSDPEVLAEAVTETAELLEGAARPVIVAGIEVHRFGLQDQLVQFAEQTGIPIAATLLGKSVVRETHPLYIGLYEGAMGRPEVTKFVEESDLVLLLGAFMTDINLGIFTANLNPANCVYATSEALRVHHHHFHNVLLEDFLQALLERRPAVTPREIPAAIRRSPLPFELRPEQPITVSRLFARLNEQLDEQTIVIADIGDALFGATELEIHGKTDFISPAYYTSMGFAVPAALGACVARPGHRVVAVCGDGAFQMTGLELSTIIRNGFRPIVIVLDNRGYGTERVLHPGDWEYNEIQPWAYHRFPEVLGGGVGYDIRTEGEFDEALRRAWDDPRGMSLLQVHIDPADSSGTLRRLAERLASRV